MRIVVDYAQRAAECRRLAAEYTTKAEHWAHFSEMAETWEMLHGHQQEKLKYQEELRRQEELKQQEELRRQEELKQEELKRQEELKHQQEKSRLQTIALADQFRNVLLLSEADNKEKAA
jgi:hypothetical protein